MTPPLSAWGARTLRRSSWVDVTFAAVVLACATLAIVAGRRGADHLSIEGAAAASTLLDRLEIPKLLPNATLRRDDGTPARLWDVTSAERTIVTFYAPWCAPCQEELPLLVSRTSAHPERLCVIVSPDEDPSEVRRELTNLGLDRLHYFVDSERQVETGGRLTALPTTFLLAGNGRVRDRIVGYSPLKLEALTYKAVSPSLDEPDVD